MMEAISSILRKNSFGSAEHSLNTLLHSSNLIASLVDEKELANSIYLELLHTFLEVIESDQPILHFFESSALFNILDSKQISLQGLSTVMRQLRQNLFAGIQQYSETLETVEECKQVIRFQQKIQDYLDQMSVIMLSIVSSNVKEPSFWETAWHELAQIITLSEDIPMIVIDTSYIIREANQAIASFLQVGREQIIGGNIDELFKPNPNKRFIQWAVERGEQGQYVTEFFGKWAAVTTRPIYHHGKLAGAIAVARDLAQVKALEEELNKREALASVGQLAAGLAHEIRNPLTSIKGFVQLLREQANDKQNDTYYSVILSEIERIDGLINDVLVLARYRDDHIFTENFQVSEEVIGVVRLLEPELNRHGIGIDLKIDTVTTWIHGYRARIKQVFLNLFKNALEAIVDNGTTIHINVFSTINQVVVSVEDDGPGIPEQVKQQLFVPFFTTKSEGTGLGLSTSRQIVIDHGGEISGDNSLQFGGARFEVRLPLLHGS